jgi:hypothetical protein
VLDSVPSSRRRLDGSRRRSRLRIALAIIGAALIAGGLIYGGEHIHLGGEDNTPSGSAEIRLSSDSAAEFDPEADGRETGTQRLAVDSNPTGTAWSTEHYDTQDFGGLKDGVGLTIDAGHTVTAKSMQIRSPTPDWNASIYESSGSPPSELSGWGQPVASVTNGGANETINLPGKPAQSFLIWITKPPHAKDDPGRYQMEISDVRLFS